jgi:hypothetical protein
MKSKIIPCLALVVSGILFGSSTTALCADSASTVLVRLTGVAQTPNVVPHLVARFVPITINYPGGGAKGLDTNFVGSSGEHIEIKNGQERIEAKIGKEFSIEFKGMSPSAHEQTIRNVISSCALWDVTKDQSSWRPLKLDLVLSMPTTDMQQSSSEPDFSHWIIKSVDIHKLE